MSAAFELDPRIAAGSLPLGETALCLIRLMNDRRYPWLVLVPRRAGLVEFYDLAPADRHHLADEAAALAEALAVPFGAVKINIGTLGNKVRQFHLHVIVRREGDAAWPDGVWNGTPSVPYVGAERDAMIGRLRTILAALP